MQNWVVIQPGGASAQFSLKHYKYKIDYYAGEDLAGKFIS